MLGAGSADGEAVDPRGRAHRVQKRAHHGSPDRTPIRQVSQEASVRSQGEPDELSLAQKGHPARRTKRRSVSGPREAGVRSCCRRPPPATSIAHAPGARIPWRRPTDPPPGSSGGLGVAMAAAPAPRNSLPTTQLQLETEPLASTDAQAHRILHDRALRYQAGRPAFTLGGALVATAGFAVFRVGRACRAHARLG